MAAGGVLVGRGYISIRPEFEGDWDRSVNTRASNAGRGGAAAFSRAFGVGLKGIGALAGVAIAANLSSAAAGAAALAPALATAGAAAGALNLGLSGVGDAMKTAFDPKKAEQFNQAMATLAPNAQNFVRSVQAIKPAWDQVTKSVQSALFENLGKTLSGLTQTTMPILQRQLTVTAGIWNSIAKNAASGVQEMAKSGTLDKILKGANDNLRVFQDTPKQLITALGQLSVAAQPAFNGLLKQFSGFITSFTQGIGLAFASGGLQDAINTAFTLVGQLGTALGNALGIITSIGKAASDAGGQIIGVLGSVLAELNNLFKSPQMQASMRSLFASVSQIVGAIVPVIGSVVQALVPLLAAVAPFIAQLAQALGPVLQQLATTLGAALMPIIQALAPVLVTVGTAILQIVQSVMPLLQPIATLIAGVVNALAPALTPVISVVTGLVGVLVGPLTQVVQALTPALVTVGGIIAQVFQALEPFLAPLVNLIGQVAGLIATVFASALTQLMGALQPLIPVGMQLITTVLDALTPILPTLGTAFGVIADALVSMIGPLAQVWGSLAQQLAPILVQLAPILGQVAVLFASTLAQVLPPLATAVLSLVNAFLPLFPVIGQIAGMILQMAGGVLIQLLPSLLQLAQAVVQLAVALLPILPSLAQIVALVLELAVKVLSWLLPPLISLAGFLIGVFVSVLSTVIGWVAGLVKIIADLVTWVVTNLGPAFRWLNDKVVQPVWRAIQTAISWAWTNVIKPMFGAMQTETHGLGDVFRWLYDKVIKPVWDGISSAIGWVWKNGIKPAFDALKSAIGKVGDAFGIAKDAIGKAWSKIQDLTKKPINFVIGTVWNNGIVAAWKKITSWIPGVPQLGKLPLLAQGGMLPVQPGVFNKPTAIVGEGNRCIARGTLVETEAGPKAIEDISPGERVITRNGHQLVIWSGLTRPDAEVLRLSTATGHDVVCTPDHRIWSARGVGHGDGGRNRLSGGSVRRGGIFPHRKVSVWDESSCDESRHDRPGRGGEVPMRCGFQPGEWPVHSGAWSETHVHGGDRQAVRCEEAVSGLLAVVWGAADGEGAGGAGSHRGAGRCGCVSGEVLQARASLDAGEHVHESAWDPRLPAQEGQWPRVDAAEAREQSGVPRAGEGEGPRVSAPEACWREAQELRTGDWVFVLVDGELCASQVVKVTPAERTDTYDLNVDGHHEFVAGGILVHNSHPEYVIPTDPKYRARALSLWQAAGGQLMADGGILGGIVGGIKNIGSKIGGVLSSASGFLKNPGKALDSLMGKLLGPLQDIKNSSWGKLALALPRAILGGLKDLVTGGGGGGPIGGSIPKGQRLVIINQALAAAGVPPPGLLAQWQAGLNTLITRESGWNANAINRWDSNAKAGHPSQGLAQTIPGTFNAYVPKSLKSRGILDPVANVAAAIRYIVARYGNITNVQQANANEPPAGYDSGGWLQPGYTLAYNGTGRPEPVLTGAQWRTMTAAAGTGGLAAFTGDLYLDSGEFLGKVRGVARQEVHAHDAANTRALISGRTTP